MKDEVIRVNKKAQTCLENPAIMPKFAPLAEVVTSKNTSMVFSTEAWKLCYLGGILYRGLGVVLPRWFSRPRIGSYVTSIAMDSCVSYLDSFFYGIRR